MKYHDEPPELFPESVALIPVLVLVLVALVLPKSCITSESTQTHTDPSFSSTQTENS